MSPNYAREIAADPSGGVELDKYLREKVGVLEAVSALEAAGCVRHLMSLTIPMLCMALLGTTCTTSNVPDPGPRWCPFRVWRAS